MKILDVDCPGFEKNPSPIFSFSNTKTKELVILVKRNKLTNTMTAQYKQTHSTIIVLQNAIAHINFSECDYISIHCL